MKRKHELREEIKAIETRRGLGMMGGPGLKLPDEYLRRVVSAVLHRTDKNYDWDRTVNRRRKSSYHLAADVDGFLDKVKKELSVERFPSGVKDRVLELGAQMEPVIRARQKLAKTEDREVVRGQVRWAGTLRRAKAAVAACDWFRHLIRATGESSIDVRPFESATRWSRKLCVESSVIHTSMPWADTGQMAADAKIQADIRKSWYGRVYRRGIAVVEGCFVHDAPIVDADESIAAGVGCPEPRPVCHLVDVTYRKVGFRLDEEKRWVEIGCGPPKFVRVGR